MKKILSMFDYLRDLDGVIERRDSNEAADMMLSIEKEVNSLTFSPQSLVEKICGDGLMKQGMRCLALNWVSFVSWNRGILYPDGRNEDAVSRCEYLMSHCMLGQSNLSDVWKKLLLPMKTMHRTLMQSFTSAVFCFIAMCSGEDKEMGSINKVMVAKYGDDWWALPYV